MKGVDNQMGYASNHKIDAILDRDRLNRVLEEKGYGGHGGYKELWYQLTKHYGLDWKYNSFMNVVHNDSTWRLLYALTLCEFLGVNVNEVFQLVTVTEEMKQKRNRWKKKKETDDDA